MSLYSRIGILTLAITLGWSCSDLTSKLNAQGLGNSPYSSLGMGEFYGDAYSDNAGMGQSGVSTSTGFQINNLNPALWVRNRFTTLDIGLIGQYKEIVSGAKKQGNAGGNLAYVALSFPISPKWALGISLKPYTFVDYENTSSRNVSGAPDINDYIKNYATSGTVTPDLPPGPGVIDAQYVVSGKGGINKASITNSFQIGKYLSVGLETSYFFGNVRKASEVSLGIPGANYVVSLNERSTYSDIAFRGGAALRIPIKKDNKLNLNLGGTYSFSTTINATQTTSFELTQSGFNVVDPDTLQNNLSGGLKIPEQFQVGASLEWPFKMIVSVDYNHQSWSNYRNFSNSNDNLKDVGRFNVGLEYLPRFSSLNYFDLVRYRIGFSHGKTPYTIGKNDVNDTNVSIGFTFPMGRGYQNFLSLALVGGQRGNTGAGMIRERYGRAVLGITLLDRWFVKQKID
jgi:hypothetical protein